jgi:hypothetical protein
MLDQVLDLFGIATSTWTSEAPAGLYEVTSAVLAGMKRVFASVG